jgi:hypothetical protein
VWARTVDDRAIPIDPEPHKNGSLIVIDVVANRGESSPIVAFDRDSAKVRYMPHHATCVAAWQFRRKRAVLP